MGEDSYDWGDIFDLLMSEYKIGLKDVMNMTRAQQVLLSSKIQKRQVEYYKFQAKLHDKYKPRGLDKEGAISIEEMLDKGHKLM